MLQLQTEVRSQETGPPATGTATITFDAENVTGTACVSATFQTDLLAGAAAKALASEMALPANTPWALRNEGTSEFLDDAKPIGEQVRTGDKVIVTPKSHLG